MKCHVCDTELVDLHSDGVLVRGWCDTCSSWVVANDLNDDKSVIDEYSLTDIISDRVYANSDICLAMRGNKVYCDVWFNDDKINTIEENTMADLSNVTTDAVNYLYQYVTKIVLFEINLKK